MSSYASFHGPVQAVMIKAAETAIMPRYGKLIASDMHEKAVDELVTVADRESEHILTEGLRKLLPDASIVGEEAADANPTVMDRLGSDLCWVIDPLDGTGNFAASKGPFGILVALAECGIPVCGWILDPVTGRFCAAARAAGAFVNGELARSAASRPGAPTIALSTLLRRSAEGQRLADRMERQFATVAAQRCAAEQYPSMVFGGSDVTLFGRTLPWDHAAGILFLSEAGGAVARLDGSTYRVDDDREVLVAARSETLLAQTLAVISTDR